MKTLLNSVVALTFFGVVGAPQIARAHCDTMDGPVVKTAQKALETGKIRPVLAWVQPADEAEVKAAFQKALSVRKLSPEAKALADQFFFETLVRVHRSGEGAPYTGLKPSGLDHGPAIPAADKVIESGSLDAVTKLVVEGFKAGLQERLKNLRALKAPGDDVAAGREWVEAYVKFIHYVEGVYQSVSGKGLDDEGAEGREAHGETGSAEPAGHTKHHRE